MYPPKSFNPKHYIDLCEALLCQDETLMALNLLEMVPGYFRDHYPIDLYKLKRKIMEKIATPSFYATHKGCELDIPDEVVLQYQSVRLIVIGADVKALNDNGITPHIYDMGPGESALPLLLKSKGLKFSYQQIYLNEPTHQATKHRFKDVEDLIPNDKSHCKIFVATEVIEHLHCESEIRFEMERYCGLADVVHISTPLYSFDFNRTDWLQAGDLGHLRTYTPREFEETVRQMFPEYALQRIENKSSIQHIRLVHPDTECESLKGHYKLDEGDNEN